MNKPKTITPNSKFEFKASQEENNLRLDTYVANQFSSYSRSFFKKLILDGNILINGKKITKPSTVIKTNDEIIVHFPDIPKKNDFKPIIDDLGIKVIYEHPDFLIIDKPAGVLVHQANSNKAEVTLVDWLLAKFNEISESGSPERPGIVHRIDLQTSGLLIIPRNNFAHKTFGEMFKNREIKKTYLALVEGAPEESGSIDFAIARHPNGHKMTWVKPIKKLNISRGTKRDALTKFKVLKYFKDYSLVEAKPLTGRTHQIRVHFAAIGHPLIGDIVYGKKSKLIERQALHAYGLEFNYEGQNFKFKANPPTDILNLIE